MLLVFDMTAVYVLTETLQDTHRRSAEWNLEPFPFINTCELLYHTFNLIGTLTGHCSTCASNLCAICVVSFQSFLLFLNHFLSLRIFRNHTGICQLVVVNHNVFDPPSSKKNKFLTFYMYMPRNRICSQVLIP